VLSARAEPAGYGSQHGGGGRADSRRALPQVRQVLAGAAGLLHLRLRQLRRCSARYAHASGPSTPCPGLHRSLNHCSSVAFWLSQSCLLSLHPPPPLPPKSWLKILFVIPLLYHWPPAVIFSSPVNKYSMSQ
jgi:hypothetical protein